MKTIPLSAEQKDSFEKRRLEKELFAFKGGNRTRFPF